MDRFLEADFKSITKEDWIEKLIKDLKGKDIQELYAKDSQIEIDPFAMHSDLTNKMGPLLRPSKGWVSLVRLVNTKDVDLNTQLLQFLEMGVEGVQLSLNENEDLSKIYQGVYANMIYNDISGVGLDQFNNWISEMDQAQVPNHIRGCLNLDKGLSITDSSLSNFHYYKLEESLTGDVEEKMLGVLTDLIALLDRGVGINQIQIRTVLGHNILENIVKIRTYRIIVANLLEHYNKEQKAVFIAGDLAELLKGADEHQQLIIATSAAVSGVTAGLDLLSLMPAAGNDDESARLGLNIQLILKLESRLDKIEDPLSGSYVIESSCGKLANKLWDKL